MTKKIRKMIKEQGKFINMSAHAPADGSRNSTRLYLHYISINIRSMMQYKTSFFLSVAGQFLISFSVFLGMFFMFQRFSRVEGFSYSQVLLCCSIFLLSISLAEMFGRGFDAFSGIVRRGEFDRILVRPRNEILQVLGSKFELTRVGRMLQAVIMFTYGIAKSQVVWDVGKVVTVVCMLVGGTVLFTALFIIYAAFCFFTLEGLEVMNIFTDGAREFGMYPLGIYGKKILMFTTFCIPYALVQYEPFLYIIGHRTESWRMVLPLLAGWILFPALLFWKLGVRHYTSSGS